MKRKTYQDGVKDGIGMARKMVKQDISMIYGMMSVLLLENGNEQEDVEALIMAIQERWTRLTNEGVDIRAYLKEKLPFEIAQGLVDD